MANAAIAGVDAAITCCGLTKVYDSGKVALRSLSLEIPRGMAFGLLGENGAGKSTFTRLVLGLDRPSSGTLRVLGEAQVTRAHGRIGYIHERPVFERALTGRDYLRHLARLAGLWGSQGRARVEAALERTELQAAAGRRIGGYSKGMQQRLAIAQALLTEPELLVLDEPTSGLDPGGQHEVRAILQGLRGQGTTLLLCSHALAEVELLCDAVGILRRGELVRAGAVSALLRGADAVEIVVASDEPARMLVDRLELAGDVLAADGDTLRIRATAQAHVLAALVGAQVGLRSLNPVTRTLEDVYLGATRAPVSPEGRPL